MATTIDERIQKCADELRQHQYEIIELQCRPDRRDQRLGIDIVAYDRINDLVAFVLVRSHKDRSLRTRMLNCYKYRELQKVRKAGKAWVKSQKWTGQTRIDVMDIYEDGSIDHYTNEMPFGKCHA